MKKFFTGMLVLALLASLIGCSAETSTSADASASNLIYENTISPNEKYIAQESDKVFYTIQVYQEENGVKVASSSNSAFSQAMSYQVETAEPITKENINVQWQTLTGSTEDSKGDQFAVADVTISVQGKVISERKVSFIGKALEIRQNKRQGSRSKRLPAIFVYSVPAQPRFASTAQARLPTTSTPVRFRVVRDSRRMGRVMPKPYQSMTPSTAAKIAPITAQITSVGVAHLGSTTRVSARYSPTKSPITNIQIA